LTGITFACVRLPFEIISQHASVVISQRHTYFDTTESIRQLSFGNGVSPFISLTFMTKRKYKDGGPIPYPSGPTNGIGGYELWNWCSRCCDIYTKDIRHCHNCGCMLRTTSKYKYGAKPLNIR